MSKNVILGLRFPRVLAAIVVGASLSISGVCFQGIFNNPLVSPDFLGVSQGSCIGAAIAILFSMSAVFINVFAFVFLMQLVHVAAKATRAAALIKVFAIFFMRLF